VGVYLTGSGYFGVGQFPRKVDFDLITLDFYIKNFLIAIQLSNTFFIVSQNRKAFISFYLNIWVMYLVTNKGKNAYIS